jgi:hypothetical protein
MLAIWTKITAKQIGSPTGGPTQSAEDKAVQLCALVLVEGEMVDYMFECHIKGQPAYQMMKPV